MSHEDKEHLKFEDIIHSREHAKRRAEAAKRQSVAVKPEVKE